jgi:mevalonate kinase
VTNENNRLHIYQQKKFTSKVLLFGEYSVIRHSMALAMPFSLFEGVLDFYPSKRSSDTIDRELQAFLLFMKKHQFTFEGEVLDGQALEFDIGQGLHFQSSIPEGFGLGSSGALVAAIYHRYAKNPLLNEEKNYFKLKKIFSQMESHFHGASSGIDPLISYINRPLLFRSAGPEMDLRVVDLPPEKNSLPETMQSGGGLFLLNTKRARRTEPLVNLFLEKCKDPIFSKICEEELIPINDQCIDAFLHHRYNELEEAFARLSAFQFEYFRPMIPQLYLDLWEEGLKSKRFYLKLCGAGGGGFLMGLRTDREIPYALQGHEWRWLFSF